MQDEVGSQQGDSTNPDCLLFRLPKDRVEYSSLLLVSSLVGMLCERSLALSPVPRIMSLILGHDRDLGHSFRSGIVLANRNDVIEAHTARSGVGSVFGDVPAVTLFDHPLDSAALSTFHNRFERVSPAWTMASVGVMVTEADTASSAHSTIALFAARVYSDAATRRTSCFSDF